MSALPPYQRLRDALDAAHQEGADSAGRRRALFAKVKDHLVPVDDDVACKVCGKRFEIPSHRGLIFLEELEGLPQDDEEE